MAEYTNSDFLAQSRPIVMQPLTAIHPSKEDKKGKKTEKASRRHSHSKSLSKSFKRNRQEKRKPFTPIGDKLLGVEMKVSEKIALHINNAEKVLFCRSLPEELVDAIAKFLPRQRSIR